MVMNAVATDQPRGIRSSNHFGEAIITDLTTIMMDSRSVSRGEYVPAPLIQGETPQLWGPHEGPRKAV